MIDSSPEIGLALVLPLLILHAVKTHGVWFAMIWVGLTAAFGIAREVLLEAWRPLYAFQPGAALATGDVPQYVGPGWCVGIYLGALFAKGFVERSRFRGSIPPFVLAHAFFTVVVAFPVEAIAVPAGWWTWRLEGACEVLGVPCLALFGWGLGGALFGLAYRLISRKTEHNPTKFWVLLLVMPVLVAAHVAAVVAVAPWVSG